MHVHKYEGKISTHDIVVNICTSVSLKKTVEFYKLTLLFGNKETIPVSAFPAVAGEEYNLYRYNRQVRSPLAAGTLQIELSDPVELFHVALTLTVHVTDHSTQHCLTLP